jgi:hypothetical protein
MGRAEENTVLNIGTVNCRNFISDPIGTQPIEPCYRHAWAPERFGRLIKEAQENVKLEPPIAGGAPIDFVPRPQK